jgi:hypothetical protein
VPVDQNKLNIIYIKIALDTENLISASRNNTAFFFPKPLSSGVKFAPK